MERVAQWWNGQLLDRRDLVLSTDGQTWRVEVLRDHRHVQHEHYDTEPAARARIAALTGDTGWRELVPPKDEAAPQPEG